jgi:hypothetical protein
MSENDPYAERKKTVESPNAKRDMGDPDMKEENDGESEEDTNQPRTPMPGNQNKEMGEEEDEE